MSKETHREISRSHKKEDSKAKELEKLKARLQVTEIMEIHLKKENEM